MSQTTLEVFDFDEEKCEQLLEELKNADNKIKDKDGIVREERIMEEGKLLYCDHCNASSENVVFKLIEHAKITKNKAKKSLVA